MVTSARQIAGSIAAGTSTAEEQALAALARLTEMPWVGALVDVAPERLLEAARAADLRLRQGHDPGPLSGLLFAVKDNIDVAGWPTTACTPALGSNLPARDAEVVARLKAAGAIVLGKAVMHELAMGGTSNNPHMPQVRNPHAPAYITGGSSGGSAAAVAAGFCAFALGSDTGGSVPIPASLCGVAGLRPSVGRYPAAGLFATSPSRDVIGPMAASADDLRLIDAVITGERERPLPALKTLRVAVPWNSVWQAADATVQEALAKALAALTDAGLTVCAGEIEGLGPLNEAASAGFRIESSLTMRDVLAALQPPQILEALIEQTHSPAIAEMLATIGRSRGTQEQLDHTLRLHRPRLRDAMTDAMAQAGADLLLVPATPLPAVPADAGAKLVINGQEVDFFSYTRATLPAANAGLPFLSIPAAAVDGLSVGLGLIGRHGQDASMLATGAAFEDVLQSTSRRSQGAGT